MIDYFEGPVIDVPDAGRRTCARREQLSLSVLYWLQTEAPRRRRHGFPGLRLRGDITGTADGLAKAPYIRESRRIRAEYTRRRAGPVAGRARRRGRGRYPDASASACTASTCTPRPAATTTSTSPACPFEIPLGALIPRRRARTCCRPARTSAPPTSPTAATGCTRWSGTSARPPARSPRSARRAAHAPARRPHHPGAARRVPGRARGGGVELRWPAGVAGY